MIKICANEADLYSMYKYEQLHFADLEALNTSMMHKYFSKLEAFRKVNYSFSKCTSFPQLAIHSSVTSYQFN